MDERRIDLGFVPRAHQREAHERLKRFSVLVWHRRSGKTVFALIELILAALQTPGGLFAYVAPYRNQAKNVAWDYLKTYTAGLAEFRAVNEQDLSIELPNGARVRIFGADNPDALRGLALSGVVLDEVAQMRPEVWREIVRPAVADREGWVLFIGTPKGVNLFSEIYFAAVRDPEWYADLRRAEETGAIATAELDRMRREMPGPAWAQEMDCDFAAAVENALLGLEAVLAAQKRTLGEAEYLYAPKVLGIDVARYGDDRSAFCPRQGLVAFRPRVMHGLDLMTLAGQSADYIDKWKPDATFVDAGGMGAGVIDRLRQLGHQVIAVDFGGRALDPRFENRRAEMWWTLAEWVKSGGCLPDSQDLAADLTAPTYTYANAKGRLQLESKDDMRGRGLRSPDIGDGFALTFAAPVAIRTALDRARDDARAAAGNDYDPYAERSA